MKKGLRILLQTKLGLRLFAQSIHLGLISPRYAHYVIEKLPTGKLNYQTETKLKGTNIRVLLNCADFIDAHIFLHGNYEAEWVRILRPYARGGVVFDLGANIGCFTFGLCEHATQIYAFDASLTNINRLKDTITRNHLSNVQVVHRVVAERDGEMAWVHEHGSAQHSNTFCSLNSESANGVATVTVDGFIEKNAIPKLDVLKVDIEGFEPMALRGGLDSIRRFKPVILCELNQQALASNGFDIFDFYQEVLQLGYSSYSIKSGQLQPCQEVPINDNLIFLPV